MAPLSEREAEIALISRALDGDFAGVRGIVVEGGAGSGKTVLLEAARQLAERHGLRVVLLRGDPLGTYTGASALPADQAAQLFPEEETDSAVLLIDDAQWLDPALMGAAYKWVRTAVRRSVIVLTMRPAHAKGATERFLSEFQAYPATTVVRLVPLAAGSISDLSLKTTGRELSPEHTTIVAERTGGNPFLATTLLTTLRDIRVDPYTEVPEAITRWVRVQLSRCDDAAVDVARAVTVLGPHAFLSSIATLTELPLRRVSAIAERLVAVDMLSPNEPLMLVPPIVVDAVLRGMSSVARSDLYYRAGKLLHDTGAGDEVAAECLLHCSPHADHEMASVLTAAGRRASERGDPQRALLLFHRALAEPAATADLETIELEVARADVALQKGTADSRLRHLTDTAGDNEIRAEALRLLATRAFVSGDVRDASSKLREAVSAAPESLHTSRWAEIDRVAASFFISTSPGDIATGLDRLVADAHERNLPLEPGVHAIRATLLAAQRQPVQAVLHEVNAALAAGPLDRGAPRNSAFLWVASALIFADELDLADQVLDAASTSMAHKNLIRTTMTRAWQAVLRYQQGRLVDARSNAQIASEAVDAGAGLWRSWTATVEALCAVEDEDLNLARRALTLVSDESLISPMARAKIAYARGRVLLAAGQAEAAYAEFLRAGKEAAELNLPDSPDVPWRPWATITAATRGSLSEARELAAADLVTARAFGAPSALGTSLVASAAAESGDARLTLLEEAVQVLASSPSRLDVARADVELGLALLDAGQRQRAAKVLRDGLEQADLCGSRAISNAARRGLRALGHRPRRSAQSGIGALTRTERNVARLAATGASTPKIAASLTVSPRTIEWHLQTIYRKLGLSGRAELPSLRDKLAEAAD